jgi:hypothetical protein
MEITRGRFGSPEPSGAIEVDRPYMNAIPNYFTTVPSGRMTLP